MGKRMTSSYDRPRWRANRSVRKSSSVAKSRSRRAASANGSRRQTSRSKAVAIGIRPVGNEPGDADKIFQRNRLRHTKMFKAIGLRTCRSDFDRQAWRPAATLEPPPPFPLLVQVPGELLG